MLNFYYVICYLNFLKFIINKVINILFVKIFKFVNLIEFLCKNVEGNFDIY